MKKVVLPEELISYMESGVSGTFVFIDDFRGWDKDSYDVPGVKFVPSCEGNGLENLATGETWIPQCYSLRRGNLLEAQLRKEGKIVKRVILGELPLFKDFPVVIMTNCESLKVFAPVCSTKLELALFIAAVKEESEKRNASHEDEYDYSWSRVADNMISLAKFLYKANPEKKWSPLDDLD